MTGRRWDRTERERRAQHDSRPEFETQWTTAELDEAPKERVGAQPDDDSWWVAPDANEFPGHELYECSPEEFYDETFECMFHTGQWLVECACGSRWKAASEVGGARLWRRHAEQHPSRRQLEEATRASQANRVVGRSDAWQLTGQVRPWQAEALDAWSAAECRGVIEAATGTGKTIVALAAAAELHAEYGDDLRVAVVVPSVVLARQWRESIATHLRVPRLQIGEQHSEAGLEWRSAQPVLITVVNTARTQLRSVLRTWQKEGRRTLLVVDECHRAGSESNARIFEGAFDMALGLSATPERSDGGHQEVVYPGLGSPVYRYPLRKALDDRVLAALRCVNLYVDFTAAERREWDEAGRQVNVAMQRLQQVRPELRRLPEGKLWATVSRLARDGNRDATTIVALLASRRTMLSGCDARQRCHSAIVEWLATSNERTLMFHETIGAAKQGYRELRQASVRVAIEHSQLPPADRVETLKRFRRGRDRVLVAVRSLDEGLDVPEASVAVIVSGSRSVRQRIQRLGRILRQADGKQAVAVSILVRGTPEETYVGARDGELVGAERVAHHRWPNIPFVGALCESSTFAPSAPVPRLTDSLQAFDLGVH